MARLLDPLMVRVLLVLLAASWALTLFGTSACGLTIAVGFFATIGWSFFRAFTSRPWK